MDNMIRDIERRAMRKWRSKFNFNSRIVEEALDRFEYKDMLDDWWREMLPPSEAKYINVIKVRRTLGNGPKISVSC